MNSTLISIDIAKSIFQVCCIDDKGRIIQEKRLKRKELPLFIQQQSPCRIVMEACASANYWSRRFKEMGHEVALIAPQFVKPYVKGNKNDKQDARAIAEAAQRPNMRYVSPKSIAQQDMQSLLRVRESYVQMRTRTANQIRGLLAEYGIIAPVGLSSLRKKLASILAEDEQRALSVMFKELVEMQYTSLLFFG